MAEFQEVETPTAKKWKHKNGIMWVTYFEEVGDRPEFFIAYKSVLPVPAGRDPWTVDNKRISSKCRTLDEAKQIIMTEVKSALIQKIEEKKRR